MDTLSQKTLDEVFEYWFKDYTFPFCEDEELEMYRNMRIAFKCGFLIGEQEGRNK